MILEYVQVFFFLNFYEFLENTKFSIKEVDIGLCADIGTFPRINNIVGNDGWVKEIAFTGRNFDGIEAK